MSQDFEQVVLPHLDAAWSLALHLLRDRAEAEDVVQESVLRALRYQHTLRDPTRARAWFLAIVRRECTGSRPRVDTVPYDAAPPLQLVDDRAAPDDHAARRMLAEQVAAAVDALPDRLREVVVLREAEHCSYEEIAQIMDIPVGTVMSRLARARERLGTALRAPHGRGTLMTDHDDELSALLREAFPRERAPERLHAWARERARDAAEDAPERMVPVQARAVAFATPARRRRAMLRAAGMLLCVALGYGGHALVRGGAPSAASVMLPDELVDDHVRALATGHLTDVVSSDRHTVKPWFAGRTDLAPRVVSLDSAGFPLLGGRLSYVQGHRAAVLVYGRRQHTIDLYVWRATAEDDARDGRAEVAGHALEHWWRDGLAYWAVTDASADELAAFRAAYEAAR